MRNVPARTALAAVVSELTRAQSLTTDPELVLTLKAAVSVIDTVAADVDDGVAWRLSEEDRLTGLLRRGAELLGAQAAARLRAALDDLGVPTDLRISALDDRLDVLLAELIDLHAWLEDNPSDAGTALVADIWAFLVDGLHRQVRKPGMTAY
jgi:hypothetical protein